MNYTTKNLQKFVDKNKSLYRKPKIQIQGKNNQKNQNNLYKNKINYKDSDDSENKNLSKLSRTRNKEYLNKLEKPKSNIKHDIDIKTQIPRIKSLRKANNNKININLLFKAQKINGYCNVCNNKEEKTVQFKKNQENQKQTERKYLLKKNEKSNFDLENTAKMENSKRFISIKDYKYKRKLNKQISQENGILDFDNLKDNVNNKLKTKKNSQIVIESNADKFSVIGKNKLLKIKKEKITELFFGKNSKVIQNFLITKNAFNIFQKKKILKFVAIKSESINILHEKKFEHLSLKNEKSFGIISNIKKLKEKGIQTDHIISKFSNNIVKIQEKELSLISNIKKSNNKTNLTNLSNDSSTSENSLNINEKNQKKIIKLPNSPKGLENFSLNCYMNSILQCLYHVKQLRTSFINPNIFSQKTQKICYNFSKIMYGLTYTSQSYYSPKDFKKIFAEKNILFSGTKGGDVKDLLQLFISSILEEIPFEYPDNDSEEDNTNQKKCFEDAKKNVDLKNPINNIFNFYEETIFKCPGCRNKCYSIQNETIIDFELVKISKKNKGAVLDLYKCFDYNYDSNNYIKFYCDKCQKSYNGEKNEKILIPPKNMILILNRGKDKIFDGDVDFYEYINIQKYVDDTFIEEKNKKFNYKLIGVSTHMGSSSDCGHYIAYCFRENENKYFCFNDEYSRIVDFKDVKNNSPYILFYEQCEEIPEKIEKNEFNININPKNVNKKDNKEEKILKQNLIDILEDFKTENNSFSIDYYDLITENPLNLKLLIDKKGRQPLPFKMDFSNNFPEKIPKISIDFDDKNSSIIKKLEKYRRNIQDPAQLKKYILELIKYII